MDRLQNRWPTAPYMEFAPVGIPMCAIRQCRFVLRAVFPRLAEKYRQWSGIRYSIVRLTRVGKLPPMLNRNTTMALMGGSIRAVGIGREPIPPAMTGAGGPASTGKTDYTDQRGGNGNAGLGEYQGGGGCIAWQVAPRKEGCAEQSSRPVCLIVLELRAGPGAPNANPWRIRLFRLGRGSLAIWTHWLNTLAGRLFYHSSP